MKLHVPNTDGLNLFTAYGDDYAAVNQEKYQKNIILLPESILPECTGKRLRFPPGELLRPFALAGIGLDVMDLQAACRTYNILAAEGRKVAAALLFD